MRCEQFTAELRVLFEEPFIEVPDRVRATFFTTILDPKAIVSLEESFEGVKQFPWDRDLSLASKGLIPVVDVDYPASRYFRIASKSISLADSV